MIKINRTGDEDFPRHIKALVLGSPKSGKSTFASTAPNVLVANYEEGGLMSVAHKDVPFTEPQSVADLEELLSVLEIEGLRKSAAAQMGMEDFDTFIIDTLDELQRKMMDERLKQVRRSNFQRDDWGWLKDTFSGVVKRALALPMHVILLCHTKTSQDDESRIITTPGLVGSVDEEIAGWVGFSVMMERNLIEDPVNKTQRTEYALITEGNPKNPHLGNRAAGRLTSRIQPTFEALHSMVFDGLTIPARSGGSEVQTDQVTSAPAQAPAVTAAPAPSSPAAGVPSDDSGLPASDVAKERLSKMYEGIGLKPPTSNVMSGWTMGEARDVARLMKAADDRLKNGDGTDAVLEELESDLSRHDAWNGKLVLAKRGGKIPQVLAWVGEDEGRAQLALKDEMDKGQKARASLIQALSDRFPDLTPEKDEEEEKPEPAGEEKAEEGPSEESEQSEPSDSNEGVDGDDHDKAVEVVKEALGATEVAEEKAPEKLTKDQLRAIRDLKLAPPCEDTGKPIDDLDIAQLSLSRFDAWLCFDAFQARVNAANAS